MNQIYPDETLIPILAKVVGAGLNFHLYTNNLTPDLDTVVGDFIEAAWSGYAEQLVVIGDFTIQSVVSRLGTIIAPPVSFANTSGSDETAYGYYVTDDTTGDLVACARFDGAPVTVLDGGSRQVIPVFADFSGLAS